MIRVEPASQETGSNVAVLVLDRQDRRNALDTEQCHRLRQAVEQSVGAGARAIVITGAGSSFCSGADFGEVYGDGFRDALYTMLHAVQEAPVPVLAAVNGPAIGAGLQLAIACDLRVAAPEASFAVPTARIGLAVDPWTVRRLALLAGGGAARAMLIGCRTLGAEQAHSRGLVDEIGDLTDARRWAAEIATFAPLTLGYSKRALNELFESDLDDERLSAAFEACWCSADLAEGRLARQEKRAPVFEGR